MPRFFFSYPPNLLRYVMQLPAQAIATLCAEPFKLVSPAKLKREVIRGKSAGLSAASYDMTIGHDLTLGVHPGLIIAKHIEEWGFANVLPLQWALKDNPSHTALAFTEEDLDIPNFIGAQVADKSSYARIFVSALNTFADPGFKGNLTLELINHGPEPVVIKAGDPIVQLLFTALSSPTDRPYDGKYMHQTKAAHGPRIEPDGTATYDFPDTVPYQGELTLTYPEDKS